MRNIIVIGGGGHAKVVVSLLKKTKRFCILGYTDLHDRGPLLGIPYLGNDDAVSGLLRKNQRPAAALGIGSILATEVRKRLFEKYEAFGLTFPAIVSPDAVVNESVDIGAGTVVADGVIVNSGTRIGRGVILNTHCSVDHDCDIRDFAHLAPGVTVSGGVRVGAYCLVGTGVNIIHGISIADRTTIGAGATVIRNILKAGTYVGLPARRKP
jgi:sugar O-acyltransferase (sialic acid O-acetyltransferase NeuD family)